MARIAHFFVFITTFVAGCALPSTRDAAKETQSESIGTATMKADRTIILQLRATLPDGAFGEGYFEYPQGHAEYRKILEHVGPISPGQSALVPPWPETKKPNKAPEPTTTSGTVAAEPLGVPAAVVAHL